MKEKWTPHIITVMAFVVFIVLGLASASSAPAQLQGDLVGGNLTIHDGVTSIKDWEWEAEGLTSVTIPNSVTSIGRRAFADNRLTSVTIPDSITSIGNDAFYNNQLTSVTIGANVNFIEFPFRNGFEGAYDNNGKTAGTYVRKNTNSTAWGRISGDFLYNVGTTTITIVGYIGSNSMVTIPSTINNMAVTSIKSEAFRNNQLTSVTIPNSITSIEWSAFANNQLTSVTIGNSIKTIPSGAFSDNQLTSVTIPNSVTSIEERAFANNQLTSVTIPNSVTSIGYMAFRNNQLTSVTIGNGIKTIPNDAFANNQLTSITIPDSVTSIGQSAFANNPLTSITIGNGVGKLNENVFIGSLRNVTRISIGANVNLEGYSDVVWTGFSSFYLVNGNRAGTYTLSNGRWSGQYR